MNEIVTINPEELAKIEWIAERNNLLKFAGEITQVESDEELELAGQAQSRLTKHSKRLKEHRMQITRRIDAVKKTIITYEGELGADLTKEKDRIHKLNNEYVNKKAAEARRKAEAEQAKIRAEAEKITSIQQSQEEQAKELFGDAVSITQDFHSQPTNHASRPKLSTSATRSVRRPKFTVIDENKIPRQFLSVNEETIRAYLRYQTKLGNTPEIEGVKIWYEFDVQSK